MENGNVGREVGEEEHCYTFLYSFMTGQQRDFCKDKEGSAGCSFLILTELLVERICAQCLPSPMSSHIF